MEDARVLLETTREKGKRMLEDNTRVNIKRKGETGKRENVRRKRRWQTVQHGEDILPARNEGDDVNVGEGDRKGITLLMNRQTDRHAT